MYPSANAFQFVHSVAEVKASLEGLLPAVGRSLLFLRRLKDVVLLCMDEETQARCFIGQVHLFLSADCLCHNASDKPYGACLRR